MPQRITLLTPLDDVLARIAGCVNPIGAQWIDDLASILDRTVAEDIRAEMPLPPRAITLRDGWALSSGSCPCRDPSRCGRNVCQRKRRNELVAGAQWCRKRRWILIPLGVKLHRSNPELPTSALGQKRTLAWLRSTPSHRPRRSASKWTNRALLG